MYNFNLLTFVSVYKCDTCHKSFFNEIKLKDHVKIHIENRLISCSYENCNRTYLSKYSLNQHVKTKHYGKRFYCDICSAGLTSKTILIQHIQRHNVKKAKIQPKKQKQKKKRKDTGMPKRSAITKLIGLDLPSSLEKIILERDSTVAKTEESDKNLNNKD